MAELVIELLPSDDRSALVMFYDDRDEPQPVHLCLDLDDGCLFYWINPEVDGNGMPARHWHGVVQSWAVPVFTTTIANMLLEEVREHAQQLLDDADTVGDGDAVVGQLGEQAMAAYSAIAAYVEAVSERPGAVLCVSDAVDFYSDPSVAGHVLGEIGLTGDTTDVEIAELDDRLAAEALAEQDTVVVRIDRWLRQQRDNLVSAEESGC